MSYDTRYALLQNSLVPGVLYKTCYELFATKTPGKQLQKAQHSFVLPAHSLVLMIRSLIARVDDRQMLTLEMLHKDTVIYIAFGALSVGTCAVDPKLYLAKEFERLT